MTGRLPYVTPFARFSPYLPSIGKSTLVGQESDDEHLQAHRFPPQIISYAVWLYHRFNLSQRDIEDLMADACGVASPPFLSAFGFGGPLNLKDTGSAAYITHKNHYAPVVQMLADEMGVTLDGVEGIYKSSLAEKDMQVRGALIEKGTGGTAWIDHHS